MLIFLPPILLGLGVALIHSGFNLKALQIPRWKASWLVLLSFLIMVPVTRPQVLHLSNLEDQWAAILLGSSQIFLLVFIMLNIRYPGMWVLGLGFLLNFLCMQANGGLMPMQPEKLAYLTNNPDVVEEQYLNARFGNSKDIILEQSQTHLWLLDDRFIFPEAFRYRVVFSLGDIIICFGLFYSLVRLSPGSLVFMGAPYEYKRLIFRGNCPKRHTCE